MEISSQEKKYILSEFKRLEQYRDIVHTADAFADIDTRKAAKSIEEIAAAQIEARRVAEQCRLRIWALSSAIRDSVETAHKQSDHERIASALYQNLVLGMRSYEVGLTSSTIAKYRKIAIESAARRMYTKGLLSEEGDHSEEC